MRPVKENEFTDTSAGLFIAVPIKHSIVNMCEYVNPCRGVCGSCAGIISITGCQIKKDVFRFVHKKRCT
eukprot:m.1061750 g.1061750  ORF g.1061750 m.1061750 type:complete len:69 (+) comp24213_c0_seq2:3469-3675(+)